jgi:hypothetical protein
MLSAAVAPAKAIPVYQGGAYIRVGQTYPVYPRTFIYNAPPTSTIIYSNSSPSNLIYGSPIPSPVPLNQGTVIYHSDGVYNVNPVAPFPGQVITPGVYDPFSTNTVIVNPGGYPGYTNYGYSGYGYSGYSYGYPGNTSVYIRR